MTRKKKKDIKKIFSKAYISYIILSVFLIGLGLFNLLFPYIGMEDLLFYTSMVFLLYAIVTFFCYMWARKEQDYELLLLTITNIIVGSFLFLCRDGNVQVVLGTAIIAFYLQALGIRYNKLKLLKKQKDNTFYAKLTTTVLLTILTCLVAYNLYTDKTVQTMLYGYYFIVYGIIWLLDLVLYFVTNSEKFDKYIKKSKS